MDPATLVPGDRYTYNGTVVEILRDREPHRDRFERDQIKYWARREDTNAEGWVIFGFGAVPLARAASL